MNSCCLPHYVDAGQKWTTLLVVCFFARQIPAHLMLRIESCWATPTKDPYSNIQYTFIRDRWVRTLPTRAGNNNISMFFCTMGAGGLSLYAEP